MPLQPIEAGGRRFLVEGLLQVFRREAESHIHQGTATLLCGTSKESAPIDFRIKLRGLALVYRLDTGKAAGGAQPFHRQSENIDAKGIRRVVQRIVIGVGAVIQHRMQGVAGSQQQVFTNHDKRYARGTKVFLSSGIDQSMTANINWPAEYVG